MFLLKIFTGSFILPEIFFAGFALTLVVSLKMLAAEHGLTLGRGVRGVNVRHCARDGADDSLKLIEEISVQLAGSRAHNRRYALCESGQRVMNWLRQVFLSCWMPVRRRTLSRASSRWAEMRGRSSRSLPKLAKALPAGASKEITSAGCPSRAVDGVVARGPGRTDEAHDPKRRLLGAPDGGALQPRTASRRGGCQGHRAQARRRA